jgi:hypothetical protein
VLEVADGLSSPHATPARVRNTAAARAILRNTSGSSLNL